MFPLPRRSRERRKYCFLFFILHWLFFPPSLLLFKMFQKCVRVNGPLWGRGGAVFCVVHHLPESKTSYTILGHSKGHDNNKECYRNTMLLFVRNFFACLADVHQGMFSVVLFLVRLFCNICWQKNPSRFRPTSSMIPPDIAFSCKTIFVHIRAISQRFSFNRVHLCNIVLMSFAKRTPCSGSEMSFVILGDVFRCQWMLSQHAVCPCAQRNDLE